MYIDQVLDALYDCCIENLISSRLGNMQVSADVSVQADWEHNRLNNMTIGQTIGRRGASVIASGNKFSNMRYLVFLIILAVD